MHFTPLCSFLTVLSLSLAYSHKRQSPICGAQEWNIQQFTTFTVGSSPPPAGAPSIFNYDHITFYFDDPNYNLRSLCSRSIEPGTGQLADDKPYPCDGNEMFFSYAGSSVELQRTGVKCDNATFTETGATGLSLECYGLFGGTQCETVTQVNVPVSFLEQTGPTR